MRSVQFTRGFLKHPAGSCFVEIGETRVLCTCTIAEGTPPFVEKGAWLKAEYAMLPGSVSPGRKPRDGAQKDGRSVEIQRLIGRSLRAALNLRAMPSVTFTIDCDVLQADGGTRIAAINGGWVALVDALGELVQCHDSDPRKHIPPHWLIGRVSAVSVGIVNNEIVCDLDNIADRNAMVDMNIVTLENDFVEIQGTGEKGVFDRRKLDLLLNAADGGLETISRAQEQVFEN